jgi:hypothetical protein
VGSPTWQQPDVDQAIQNQFNIQRNWLLNMLPPSREVCPPAGRGAMRRCFAWQARSQPNGFWPVSTSIAQTWFDLKIPNNLATKTHVVRLSRSRSCV